MQPSVFSQLSFRDLVGKIAYVAYPLHALMEGHDLPEDADGALAYGYIDPTQGLTLEVLAPARMEDGRVFSELDLMRALNVSAKLRAGGVDPNAAVAFPADQGALANSYADHLANIARFYAVSESRAATRDDADIDGLRHPEYPDDVQVILYDEEAGTELVWFTLQGYTQDGDFYGSLLNEPAGDFSVHAGDLMVILKRDNAEGVSTLITSPAFKLVLDADEDTAQADAVFEHKNAIACEVMRRADPFDLGTADDDSAPADEYDFEAFVAADAIPAGASAELAADVLAYILSKSFGCDFKAEDCAVAATALLSSWADAGIAAEEPAYDPREIVDEAFSRWDEAKAAFDKDAPMVTNQNGEKVRGKSTYHFIVRLYSQNWDLEDEGEE